MFMSKKHATPCSSVAHWCVVALVNPFPKRRVSGFTLNVRWKTNNKVAPFESLASEYVFLHTVLRLFALRVLTTKCSSCRPVRSVNNYTCLLIPHIVTF